ncbi:MAG: single-stranded DNA-binding protein [Acutalibacteraceae bacterium]|nr:single-stranded DNA-binding protein [Acutalibacteraceae bacterium]
MLNKVILIGRFTKDPELRSTPQSVSVCDFRLAVPRNYKTNGTYESDFIDCVAWRNTAEFISKFFKKGNLVCVEGSLQQRSWEQDGQKRFVLEVMVDNTYFVESKKEESDPMDLIEEVPLTEQGLFSGETFSAVDDDIPF